MPRLNDIDGRSVNLLTVLSQSLLAAMDVSLLGLVLVLLRLLIAPALFPLTLLGLVLAFVLGVSLVVLTDRWQGRRSVRLGRAVLVLVATLWLVKAGLSGSPGPLGGWDLLGQTLTTVSDPHSGATYLALLIAVFTLWRGTRLGTLTALSDLQDRFKRGLLLLGVIVICAVLLPAPYRDGARLAATVATIFYVTCALLAQALFRETSGIDRGRHLVWRNLPLLLVAISLPLAVTLALSAWFSSDVAVLLVHAFQALVAALLFIIAPVQAVVFGLLEALFRRVVHQGPGRPEPPQLLQRPTPSQLPPLQSGPSLFPSWLEAVVPLLPFLVPLAGLLLLFLLRPSARRRNDDEGEERESVWSWQAAGDDLTGWLSRHMPGRGHNALAAALASMRGTDPSSVIRRLYLRLLMRMASAGQARTAPQTPAEYEQAVAPHVPAAAALLGQLTRDYEQARYHPDAVTAADAEAANEAWERLEMIRAGGVVKADERHR